MKIYAVTLSAQSDTQMNTMTTVFGGESFEGIYQRAHEAVKKEFPTHSYTSHMVGFCEVPEEAILQAAEAIQQKRATS